MMDRADFETSKLPSAGVTLKDEKPVEEAPNTLPDFRPQTDHTGPRTLR